MSMSLPLHRREFMHHTVWGTVLCLAAPALWPAASVSASPALISPGCRTSKVRVAKLYLGKPQAHWPTPAMDLNEEIQRYEKAIDRQKDEFKDVEFLGNALVTSSADLQPHLEALRSADGVLLIHLSMGVSNELREILKLDKPTFLFAAPYSGHEWTSFGGLREQPEGAHFDCMLTSDPAQLAVAVRPFRAIHHLREAKILNVTSRELDANYLNAIQEKFGAAIQRVDREQVLAAYEAVPDRDAEAEAARWIKNAVKVVEPSRDEIVRSCKLALAFEQLLNDANATVFTVDCYGSMYRQLPAFPCIGNVRLNDMGLGGICESDLRSAMTHVLLQGLSGKPGFISDPTVDESSGSIILAHCLGSTRMDGPEGKRAPYKLRSIMERQEGAVPQVKMEIGRKVTQAILIGADRLQYFTGEIIDTPDLPRGCRTKITVKVDGDIEKLWHNWSNGLHRQTCYGDLTRELKMFCRYKNVDMIQEA